MKNLLLGSMLLGSFSSFSQSMSLESLKNTIFKSDRFRIELESVDNELRAEGIGHKNKLKRIEFSSEGSGNIRLKYVTDYDSKNDCLFSPSLNSSGEIVLLEKTAGNEWCPRTLSRLGERNQPKMICAVSTDSANESTSMLNDMIAKRLSSDGYNDASEISFSDTKFKDAYDIKNVGYFQATFRYTACVILKKSN